MRRPLQGSLDNGSSPDGDGHLDLGAVRPDSFVELRAHGDLDQPAAVVFASGHGDTSKHRAIGAMLKAGRTASTNGRTLRSAIQQIH